MTKIILVIVGEGADQARWTIHQALLKSHSKFAQAALKHSLKEKDDNTIRLPEEDVDAFAEFVKFVYTGCIVSFSIEMIVRMYTLADRLQAHKFADACFETLATTDSQYETAQMKFIFDNTTENDRVRRLCISQVGKGIISGQYTFDTQDARNMLSEYMGELMQGVTAAVKDSNTKRPPFAGSPSNAPTEPAVPAARAQQASTSGCHLFADPNVSQMFNDQQRAQPRPSIFGNPQPSAPPSLFGNSNGNNTSVGGRPAFNFPGTRLFGNNAGNSTLFGNRPANNSPSTGLFGGLFGQQNNSNAPGGLFRDQAYNDGYTAGVASLDRQNPFTTGSRSLVPDSGFGSSDSATCSQSNGLFSNSVRNAESDTGPHRGANATSTTNTGAATRGLFGDFGLSPFNVRPTTQTQNAGGLFGTPAFTDPDRAASTSSTQNQISGGLFGPRSTCTSAHSSFSFPSNQWNGPKASTQATSPIVTTTIRNSVAAANNKTSPTASQDSSIAVQEQPQVTGQQSTPGRNSHATATAATSNIQGPTSIAASTQADIVDASENQISGSWEDVPRVDNE